MTERHWTAATRHVFESSNAYGIPDLLDQDQFLPQQTAMIQRESGEGSLVLYKTFKPEQGSTLCFYTDDYRFEALWNRPVESLDRLLVHAPYSLIEPDYSSWLEHPFPVALWNLYRSRWLGRFWQEHGVTVLPSLAWNRTTLQLVGLGIPQGSAVACEGRPRFRDTGLFLEGLQEAVHRISPRAVLFYGAERTLLDQLPSGPDYIFCDAWSPRRRMRAAKNPEAKLNS